MINESIPNDNLNTLTTKKNEEDPLPIIWIVSSLWFCMDITFLCGAEQTCHF